MQPRPSKARGSAASSSQRVALLVTAGLLVLAPAASADTFVVNDRGDQAPGSCSPSDCTLREAAIAATELNGDDKVKLPSTKPYRLTRSSNLAGPEEEDGDLDVGTMLAVGNGLRVVHPGDGRAKINLGQAEDRAFEAIGILRLNKVNIRGGAANSSGEAGGAIHMTGSLVLRRSKLSKNNAPDVGGAIFVDQGILDAKRSQFVRNEAGQGGAAFVDDAASMSLTRTTVHRNEASSDAGGVWLRHAASTSSLTESTISENTSGGDGGGLFTEADVLSITNSTIASNSADGRGGGIYGAPDSETRMNAVTVARNRADADDTAGPDSGGGLFADGGSDVFETRNSLVAKNRTTGDLINECRAPAPVGVESLGGNLITSNDDCPFFDHATDLLTANPGIGALASNGGPTKTIGLEAGSSAIGQADGPNPPQRDQRGVLRQNPDIGAYER